MLSHKNELRCFVTCLSLDTFLCVKVQILTKESPLNRYSKDHTTQISTIGGLPIILNYFWWNLKSCLSWKKSPFQLSILLTGCLTNYFAWIHNAYVIFQFKFSGRGLVNFTMGVFFWEGMTFQPYLKEKYEVMLAIFTNQVLYLWELNFLLQFFKRVDYAFKK